MKTCIKGCLFYYLTMIANLILICAVLFMIQHTYGDQRFMLSLFLIPPVLSVLALRKGGDKEERMLKKRIRKAELRKQLKDLSEFDKD